MDDREFVLAAGVTSALNLSFLSRLRLPDNIFFKVTLLHGEIVLDVTKSWPEGKKKLELRLLRNLSHDMTLW